MSFSWPYQTSVTIARLGLHHHYCHDPLINKNNPLLPSTPCRAKQENRDTFPPPHIRQSSSRHGDTAWGLMQIFSEVTFSADTPLSLRTRIRTLAQGSLIYRFTNMCCHLLSLVQNVNYWPESLTSSGWVSGSAAIRCPQQNPQINRFYLSS